MQDFDADRAIQQMMSGRNWPRPEYMEEGRVFSPQEIKDIWDKNRADSAAAGVWTHAQCECVLNGGHIFGICAEMTLFKTFLGTGPPLLAYRTEWCIWAAEERIAGMIDFVAMNLSGALVSLAYLLPGVTLYAHACVMPGNNVSKKSREYEDCIMLL